MCSGCGVCGGGVGEDSGSGRGGGGELVEVVIVAEFVGQ